jgi:diguanylate cyclase (GGDEF)-like protein
VVELISRVIRAVWLNPRTSVQDGLLIAAVMLVSSLLALQYNLFFFIAELSEPQRKISLAEAIFLTALLAACIVAFILRRLSDERRNVAKDVAGKIELGRLKELASEDPLTGLANRRTLVAALNAATSVSWGREKHALFLIDLNHFKQVNDRYGHPFGDRVLQVVANRMRGVTRPLDLLARLGGDEFAVLSYDIDRDLAWEIGIRFVEAVEQEIVVAGHTFTIGVSIGAAMIPDHGTAADEVLENADLAMYAAKGDPASSLVFFEANAKYPQRIANLT